MCLHDYTHLVLPTWILIQFGLGRVPLRSNSLSSLLSLHQLFLKALVQIPQFTGPHHSGVSLNK